MSGLDSGCLEGEGGQLSNQILPYVSAVTPPLGLTAKGGNLCKDCATCWSFCV